MSEIIDELISNGTLCYKCNSFISPRGMEKWLCYDCRNLENNKEVCDHNKYVRCPKCNFYWKPESSEDYELLKEGAHNVICSYCEHEFEVETSITYTFTSPALVEETEEILESEETD